MGMKRRYAYTHVFSPIPFVDDAPSEPDPEPSLNNFEIQLVFFDEPDDEIDEESAPLFEVESVSTLPGLGEREEGLPITGDRGEGPANWTGVAGPCSITGEENARIEVAVCRCSSA